MKADLNDVKIGANIRRRRKTLGFTSTQFAAYLGISFQQVYKYENGQNRVPAQTLGKIARILTITTDELINGQLLRFNPPLTNDSFRAGQIANDPDTGILLKSYISISDSRTRMAVVELVTSISKYLNRKIS